MAAAPAAEPRPDAHPLWTVDHALDQITDPDRLRELARQWRAAMFGQREFARHVLEIADCPQCQAAADACDETLACERYQAWQQQYSDACDAL